MEFLWAVVAVAPTALIAFACYRLLTVRWRQHVFASGFACGAAAGLYLFALGELAFRLSVKAWIPGALFHVHTFALAMVRLFADSLAGAGDTTGLYAIDRSRTFRLLCEAAVCLAAYGLVGMLVARLVTSTRVRQG
jgi:hypothetical protein